MTSIKSARYTFIKQNDIRRYKHLNQLCQTFLYNINNTLNNKNGNGNNGNNTITKENVIKEYKIKACELFEKYIFSNDNTCPYEININYDMRKKLINLMGGNKEKWVNNEISGGFEQLYTLFDPCILEMYDLMSHSFQRFKKTAQFAKLDRKIFCKSSFPDTFLS